MSRIDDMAAGVSEINRLRAEVECLRTQLNDCHNYEKCVRDASFEYARKVLPSHVLDTHFGVEPDVDDVCSMLVAEVERLREERRWRDAKSEPPEEFVYVTVFIPGLGVSVACYKARTQAWEDDNEYECHPTHWQPLPAPPEKEE